MMKWEDTNQVSVKRADSKQMKSVYCGVKIPVKKSDSHKKVLM